MKEPIVKEVSSTTGRVRYRVTVDAGRDPATGRRRQRKARFDTLKAARAWLSETRVAVGRGTYVDRSPITLTEHLNAWLEGRVNLRPTTRRNYADALRPFRDQVGAVVLSALTRQHVEGVRDAMLDGTLRRVGRPGQPLSPRSVRLSLTILTSALESAVADGLVGRNVAERVERPSGGSAPGKIWSPEELERFLVTAASDRLHAAWLLSSHGLRRGEILGLRWDAVDLDHGQVEVRAARVYLLGKTVDSDVKTTRSARMLPLPAEVVAALRALRLRQDAERAALGRAYVDSGLVVVNEQGKPLRAESYSDRFRSLAEAAGLPTIRLHDVRAASVSRARARGVPDHVVAAWHGHTEAIMRGVYSRATPEDLRRYAEAM